MNKLAHEDWKCDGVSFGGSARLKLRASVSAEVIWMTEVEYMIDDYLIWTFISLNIFWRKRQKSIT